MCLSHVHRCVPSRASGHGRFHIDSGRNDLEIRSIIGEACKRKVSVDCPDSHGRLICCGVHHDGLAVVPRCHDNEHPGIVRVLVGKFFRRTVHRDAYSLPGWRHELESSPKAHTRNVHMVLDAPVDCSKNVGARTCTGIA